MNNFDNSNEELSYLLSVDLPVLIHRIMLLSFLNIPTYLKEFHDEIGETIKKTSNMEVDSALNAFKKNKVLKKVE